VPHEVYHLTFENQPVESAQGRPSEGEEFFTEQQTLRGLSSAKPNLSELICRREKLEPFGMTIWVMSRETA